MFRKLKKAIQDFRYNKKIKNAEKLSSIDRYKRFVLKDGNKIITIKKKDLKKLIKSKVFGRKIKMELFQKFAYETISQNIDIKNKI